MIDLLIDTDVGGDIDDALTLSMALHARDINLLGITAVYAGAQWRCGILRAMLDAYRRPGVPVLAGAEKPLIGTWGEASPGRNEAAAFIVDTASRAPCAALCIGPLTNMALALSLAPGIASNLTLYVMGGALHRAHPEWNMQCDPEAARVVLESGADVTLVPLDVTERCRLTREELTALVAGEGAEMAFLRGEVARFFTQFTFEPVLHDPLALLCLLRPDICRYEMKDIRVETRGEFTRGLTAETRHAQTAPIRVATDVRAPEAVEAIRRLIVCREA